MCGRCVADNDAVSIQTLFGLLDASKPAKTPARRSGLGLQDYGELKELLADPEPTRCPHCGKTVPPPKLRTRRRRLYALVSSAGAVLHLEIDP